MTITMTLNTEEALFVRMGLALAYNHAKDSAKAMKNDPLAVYENTEVAKRYKALQKRFQDAIREETRKVVDNRKKEGVQ